MNKYLEKFISEKFEKPVKALDLGAGSFKDIETLKEKGWFGEGVDKKMGIDLNEVYLSDNKPFDLVYSNYVLHFLKNRQQLIDTASQNLEKEGWFFLLTFDKNDDIIRGFNSNEVVEMLGDFKNISTRMFKAFDNEPGHNHWHKILEVTAQKK